MTDEMMEDDPLFAYVDALLNGKYLRMEGGMIVYRCRFCNSEHYALLHPISVDKRPAQEPVSHEEVEQVTTPLPEWLSKAFE